MNEIEVYLWNKIIENIISSTALLLTAMNIT